ncbi:MAG: bifunctional folylpolyglutamate synthase/dihydrofolate synthase, partial [Deltaproteobacteria bacterium]
MTGSPGLAWLESLQPARIELGLERIQALLTALDRPDRAYPSLHVAGTNGKGSTCAMAAAALCAAGKRTGLYTSPHLNRFEERIQIDGVPIDEPSLQRGVAELRRASAGIPLTYFEAGTALALWWFREARVDAAVLETGLGGRLDATNAVTPVAVAVTALGLDHTEILGPTLADIAREKAGIFKPGIPAVVASPAPGAGPVLAGRALEVGCPLLVEGRDFVLEAESYRGVRWRLDDVTVGLLGPHQRQNGAVALALLEQAESALGVGPDAARRGL